MRERRRAMRHSSSNHGLRRRSRTVAVYTPADVRRRCAAVCHRTCRTARRPTCVSVHRRHSTDERSDVTNAARSSFFHGRRSRVCRSTANDVDAKRQMTSPWSEMMFGGWTKQSTGKVCTRGKESTKNGMSTP